MPSPLHTKLLAAVESVLVRAPEPKAARERCERLLEALPPDIATQAGEQLEAFAEVVHAVCGPAPFLCSHVSRHPEWLARLLTDDLAKPRRREELHAALAARLERAHAERLDGAAVLRRFKYEELLRITVRDCSERLVPLSRVDETLGELSALADALLAHAFELAAAQTLERFGPPVFRTLDGRDERLSFVALGMGKLGAEELNYSSDVDLVYVCAAPSAELDLGFESKEHAKLSPTEYFARLAQTFGRLVADTTEDGFLYRVDLDLRPEGAQGMLVVTDRTLESYYESWADTWEKATFMKARPVAGDSALGFRAIDAVAPLIYRSSMDYEAVASIKELKEKIEAAHGRRQDAFDVKLDSGGIRDVEFIAQALQLLHGGRIDQVRARGTVDALERVRDVHLLPSESITALLAAYRFLRRVENRLQMHDERQTHRLLASPDERRPIARGLGYTEASGLEQFETDLASHRAAVQRVFGGFFFDRGADRIFDLFARDVPHLLATESTREMLHDLASQFAREIDASPDAERALNNLDRFIRGVGARRFYFELLLDRPELVPRLTTLFCSSKYLSEMLAAQPVLIEPVFHDPNVLLLDRAELERDFDEILAEQVGEAERDLEHELSALRLFYHRQVVNVGLLDLVRKVTSEAVDAALSDVAEVCVDRALAFASERVHAQEASPGSARASLCVIGMGKLGSREMSYGSDLDLVFLYAPAEGQEPIDAQEEATRISQRMISLLQTKTSEGSCYEVDTRLRPSGNQGTLVTSMQAFTRYHEQSAQLWERMALLRARAIAGDALLAQSFGAARRMILSRQLPEAAREEVLHVRKRMQLELANERGRRRDFKRGRGGMLDVENVAQWLQLAHGREHPELLEAVSLGEAIARLARASVLDAEASRVLSIGWAFLGQLASRLRVIENRSISDLDEEQGDLEGVARGMGYASHGRAGSARRALLADYRRHTEAIRGVFERILGPL